MKRAAPVTTLLVAAVSLALCLNGCATLRRALPSPGGSASHRPAAFDPSPLRAGMQMSEVRRLEPRPDKVVSMTSESMTVTEWIYRAPAGETTLYFNNGILESWS